MKAESAGFIKETRAVLVPWGVVMVVCALPFLKSYYTPAGYKYMGGPDVFITPALTIGVLFGIPLMAFLPFGNEFRNRTMELLLSQPVDRMKVWRDKWAVTILSVVSLAFVACLSWGLADHPQGLSSYLLLGFLVATVCSSTFWTLLARSTWGGLLLSTASLIVISLVLLGRFRDDPAVMPWVTTLTAYSALTLGMGRRMLRRYQMTGGLAGTDMMSSLPNLVPSRVAALLRCRSNQVLLNILRKEMYLLRPLWMLTGIYVLVWIGVAFSVSLAGTGSEWERKLAAAYAAVSLTYSVVAIFLAASMGIAEERACGVQNWHMALPLSMRTQWLVKLLSALLAGTLCALAIPALLAALGQHALGTAFVRELTRVPMSEVMQALCVLFFVSFWCATLVRDVTRTAGLLALAGGTFVLANQFGSWIGYQIESALDAVCDWVIAWYQLSPYFFYNLLRRAPTLPRSYEWIAVPLFLAAMTIHTAFLFRRMPLEGGRRVARTVAPYLIVEVLLTMALLLSHFRGGVPVMTLTSRLEAAVVKYHPDASTIDEVHPLSFTVEELATASTLSVNTQRWLRNARLNLTASPPDYLDNRYLYNFPASKWKVYNLTIHLASGTDCKVSFPIERHTAPRWQWGLLRCE